MKLNPQDLENIAHITLEHYNQHAEEFWEGSSKSAHLSPCALIEMTFSDAIFVDG
jgi:hypothetical protein